MATPDTLCWGTVQAPDQVAPSSESWKATLVGRETPAPVYWKKVEVSEVTLEVPPRSAVNW